MAGGTGSGEGGHDYRTNPDDGEYSSVNFAQSLYDADDDGIENPLDTCPYDPTPSFDPRSSNNAGLDDDQFFGQPTPDGVPAVCDPDDAAIVFVNVPPCPTSGIFDLDGDCFSDRGDNCPTVPNGIDANRNIIGANNQEDTDFDGIGDACDQNPTTPDGHRHQVCNVDALTIGAGGTPAIDPLTVRPCDPTAPLPTEPTSVAVDIKPGGDPNSTNLGSRGVIPVAILTTPDFDAAAVDPATVDFEGASPVHDALQDVDDDGDLDLIMHFRTQETNIADDAMEACLTGETTGGQPIEGCDTVRIVPPWLDSDGDSLGLGTPPFFGDAVEANIGTDQLAACPDDPIADNEANDKWPPDLNDDQVVNIVDRARMVYQLLSRSYNGRFDLNGDGALNIQDRAIEVLYLGQTCL